MLAIRNVTDEKHSLRFRGADSPLEGFLGFIISKGGSYERFLLSLGAGCLSSENVTDEKHSPPYRGADAPLEGFLFGSML